MGKSIKSTIQSIGIFVLTGLLLLSVTASQVWAKENEELKNELKAKILPVESIIDTAFTYRINTGHFPESTDTLMSELAKVYQLKATDHVKNINVNQADQDYADIRFELSGESNVPLIMLLRYENKNKHISINMDLDSDLVKNQIESERQKNRHIDTLICFTVAAILNTSFDVSESCEILSSNNESERKLIESELEKEMNKMSDW